MSVAVASIGLTWEVPVISALNLGNRFDDRVNFGSSTRTANAACATQSLQDQHCNAEGNFAVGTRFDYMHVKAIIPGLMDVFSQLGLYKSSLN